MSVGNMLSIFIMVVLAAISIFVSHKFNDLKYEYSENLNKERQKSEAVYFKSNRRNIIAEIDYYIERDFSGAAKFQIEKFSKYNFPELDHSIIKYCEKFSYQKEINNESCNIQSQSAKERISAKKEYISFIISSIERKVAFVFLEGQYAHINKEIKAQLDFPSVFNVKNTWVRPDDHNGVLVLVSYEAVINGKFDTFIAIAETEISGSTLEIQSLITHSEDIKNKMHLLPQTI